MQIMAVRLGSGIPEKLFADWLSRLPGKRQAEILARTVREDRERSLCGEVLARVLLSRELRCPLSAVPLCRGAHGKPVLKDNTNLFYNISHSGDYAVCVVSKRPIGIDIEQVRAYKPKLARRVCSEEELTLLAQSKDPARMFCRLWTLKESFVKCTGTGISVPLREISFAFSPQGAVFSNQKGVQFLSMEVWDGYWMAVCVKRAFE